MGASKEYYQEHSRQRRAMRREYIAAKKLELGCCECGYKEHHAALHFDHIDRDTKHKEVSKLASEGASFEAIDAEIDKCRVICANCHSIHSYEQKHFLPSTTVGEAGT